MIVELLDNTVPPWFGRWNEPKLDPVTQAETNKRSHTSWMGRTAIKSQFVVYLKVLRDSHPQPNRVNSFQNALRCTGRHRLYPAPVDRCIDGMQAIALDRTSTITGADQINLMGLIGCLRWKLRIFFALWLIPPGPPMSQFVPPKDTADRAERRNWLDLHVDQLPLDSLVAAEAIIVVQVQPNHL